MARYTLVVNGKTRSVEADPDAPLLYVLRENFALDATGARLRAVPFTPASVKAALV